ncbi:MAG: CHAT domain-containing protein [Candidatus Sulfotelmatobacter sp.]
MASNHQPSGRRRLGLGSGQLPKLTVLVLLILFSIGCVRRQNPQAAYDLAWNAFLRGDLIRAQEKANKGYDRFHGTSPEWAWKFTILQARILYVRGMYEDVLVRLSSETSSLPAGEPAVQKNRFRGLAYVFLHRFPEAEQQFGEAEQICAVSENPACVDVVESRGRLEMERGNYAKAQIFFLRVLAVARASDNRLWEADTLLDLSWAAAEQTHFDEEIDWADAARRIALAFGAADTAQTALGDMGYAYYKLGDLEKAEGMFVEAKNQAEKLGQIASEAGWLTNAGYAHMDAGDVSLAEASFRQSLDLSRKINSPGDIMDSLTALSVVSEQSGKLEDAKRYADETLGMARAAGNGRDVVSPLLVEGRVAARQRDTVAAETAFQQVAESKDTPVFLKWEAERSLARLYEDENRRDSADSEYQTALSTFEAARCGLHQRVDRRLPFLSNAVRIYEDYIHFLVAQGKTNDALRVADYARARTLTEDLGRECKAKFAPDPLNATKIARSAGGTILFYALGQEHSYLWAITPRQVRLFPLTANRPEIDAAVQRYRKKLEGPPEILDASNDGSTLYKMLVEPAQDLLKKEASAKNSTVFIIPDSGLNSLNFETLVPENAIATTSASQPKRYWVEDVTVANAASLGMLPVSRGRSSNLGGKLLLIGNSVAPIAGADNPYPELPNSAVQMENIEKYFPAGRRQVFARERATPAAYLNSHPENFSYIHFVAHGLASRSDPLDSTIILSRDPASNEAQDESFKLYARDIIGTHPLRAELVTISACQSTGTRTYSGEGLVGLSWAFLRAGARNVVGALWDVSDTSTAQLMDNFYGELKRGRPPEVALRSAKLAMLHTNEVSRRPFYWAPFQLYTGR